VQEVKGIPVPYRCLQPRGRHPAGELLGRWCGGGRL